ncbi:MAG: DNA-deoxyinosine glycosylase [Chlorobi bacterium]|nr:DNA-deoxyinosine glycosylase [Chlorobiota bacterium]
MNSFSFPPIAKFNAKILILGTMPGKKSLEINEYYGFKHNVFWRIMFELFEKDFSDDYNVKKSLLKENKIALWDTLKFCERKGSLDANIKNEEANNFKDFFYQYSDIKYVMFNGKASYNYFKKYVGLNDNFIYRILPSTSPANAMKKYEDKLKEWTIIKDILENER